MDKLTKGSHVLVEDDRMVHRVSRFSGGSKTDGSYDFYAYRTVCRDDSGLYEATHVAFEAEAPRETSAPLTCLVCIAAGQVGNGG